MDMGRGMRDQEHRVLIRIIRARSLAPGDTIATLDSVELKQGGRCEMVDRWFTWKIESMDTFGSAVVLHLTRRFAEFNKSKLMVTPPDSYQKRVIGWIKEN